MPKKLPYRLLTSKTIHQGYIIDLVKDRFILHAAKGKIVTRELVLHPGAVAVVPLVDKNHLLLLRQFRYAANGDLWEIPAGTLEKKEKTLECAKRELEEETGYKARRWQRLTRFLLAPGMSNEMMTLFKAERLEPGRKNLDHDEWIEHKTVSLKEAQTMIRRGAIRDAKTIAGILWVSFFR